VFKAWLKVFLLGIFAVWPAKILALVVVPFMLKWGNPETFPIWGNRERGPLAGESNYYHYAIKNAAFNLLNKSQPEWENYGGNKLGREDDTLENLEGFQTRWRRSLDGKYVSFRATWGKPNHSKGKKEFYIGWSLNDNKIMGLSFFQFTPFRGLFSKD